jgi:hypothetical protein
MLIAPNKPAIVSRIGNCCSTDRLPIIGSLKPALFFAVLAVVAAARSALIFWVWVLLVVSEFVSRQSALLIPGSRVAEDAPDEVFLRPNSFSSKDPEDFPPEADLADAFADVAVDLVSFFANDGNFSAMWFSVTCFM